MQVEHQLIKPSVIKKIVKLNHKRTSKAFLEMLNAFVLRKVIQAMNEHNGGKKTLDIEVGAFIGLGK